MPTEFESIFKLSYGDAGVDFQLDDYGYSAEPVIKPGVGRTGTIVTVSGEGYVQGTSAADFATKLGATGEAFSVSGQNLIVTTFGGVPEVTLLAARCIDGGPHVAFEMLPNKNEDGVALVKRFRFTATGRTVGEDGGGGGGSNEPSNSYTLRTRTGPDGLRTIEVVGEIAGAGPTGAAAHFLSVVLAQFRARFGPLGWVVNHQARQNLEDDQVEYTITFTELRVPLPKTTGGEAVDGEVTTSRSRDEQMRLQVSIRFDLVVVGDPQAVIDVLRAAAGSPVFIVRESVAVTTHKGIGVRGEFEMLLGGDGTALLNFEQSWQRARAYATVTPHSYPGLAPVLVENPQAVYRYVQHGRAVGHFVFPKAPEPMAGLSLATEPVIDQKHLSRFEKETTWRYEYVSVSEAPFNLAALGRPATPAFEG